MHETSNDATTLSKHLTNIVGAENVLTDPRELRIAATDIFFTGHPPAMIVKPRSTRELAEVIQVAIASGSWSFVARGGGLSYSAGYLTDRADTVLVDFSAMTRILEVNREDMYVHVEAGVTWERLDSALEPLALRTPFWGTGSGLRATIGASISQNATTYGAARFGSAAESVLALCVVLADGRLLKTGSWATPDDPSPFARYYGPDITGLFLADCGALGIKAELVLQLIPRPSAVRHAAFSIDSRADFAAAMSDIGRLGVASECYGFDPFFLSERMESTGFADDVGKLLDVAKAGSSLIGGLKAAVKVAAAGRRFLQGIGYSIHLNIDGRDDADVESALARVRAVCRARNAREIEASIPRMMRSSPFPPPYMMLGPHGDLWVPMHGFFPHSRHLAVLEAVDEYMNSQAELIERHGIVWGQVSALEGWSRIMVEVSLYWEDARTEMIDRYFDDSYLKSKQRFPANPEARSAVQKLRTDLIELFRRMGAVHLQIGRVYPYLESRLPDTAALVRALKQELDPLGRMNPGALGLN